MKYFGIGMLFDYNVLFGTDKMTEPNQTVCLAWNSCPFSGQD